MTPLCWVWRSSYISVLYYLLLVTPRIRKFQRLEIPEIFFSFFVTHVNDLITSKVIILSEICFDVSDVYPCMIFLEYQYCVGRVYILLEK